MIASLTFEGFHLCLCSRDGANEVFVLLGNLMDHQELKKRSPSVWRNYFVCVFGGPTKCRHIVGPCVLAVMQRRLQN